MDLSGNPLYIKDTDPKYISKKRIFNKFKPIFTPLLAQNEGINNSYVIFLVKSMKKVIGVFQIVPQRSSYNGNPSQHTSAAVMRAKLIAAIMVLLLAAAQHAPTAYAAAEAEHGEDADQVYEAIKAAAEARRDELLYLLELGLPPEILEKLEEALYTMDEAEETEDARMSTEHYIYALKLFRVTWQKYLSYNPGATGESLEEVSDKPSPEESEPPEGLDEDIKETKEKRLIAIHEEIVEWITAMGEHVDELKGYLSEGDADLVEHALLKEAEKLEKIMDKVDKGEYDDAIDDLVANEFEIEDDVDEMEDKEAAEVLKKVEKLTTQKTKEKKDKNTGEGEGADEDDAVEAERELEKIKKEFKENAEKSNKPDKDKKEKDKIKKDKDR